MTGQLQILLLSASIIVFLVILRNIKKSRIGTDMATIWILWGLGLIVISIFPTIVYFITRIIGIMAPINTIFLIMIFLIYLLVFYLYIKVSVLEEKLKNLTHAIALQNKERE